ncbi:hypothetical protein ACFQ9X_55300 [Catenulispora yoronensis]
MSESPHHIVFVAVPPVMAHDLATAQAVLTEAGTAGRGSYRLDVTTPDPGLVETVMGPELVIRQGLDLVGQADTVFVVGGGARPRADERLSSVLRTALAAGGASSGPAPGSSSWPRRGCSTAAAPPRTGTTSTGWPATTRG